MSNVNPDAAAALMYPYAEAFKAAGMESDVDLRTRVRYVAGDSPDLRLAQGATLDAIAARYGLKRREINLYAKIPKEPVRLREFPDYKPWSAS